MAKHLVQTKAKLPAKEQEVTKTKTRRTIEERKAALYAQAQALDEREKMRSELKEYFFSLSNEQLSKLMKKHDIDVQPFLRMEVPAFKQFIRTRLMKLAKQAIVAGKSFSDVTKQFS